MNNSLTIYPLCLYFTLSIQIQPSHTLEIKHMFVIFLRKMYPVTFFLIMLSLLNFYTSSEVHTFYYVNDQ